MSPPMATEPAAEALHFGFDAFDHARKLEQAGAQMRMCREQCSQYHAAPAADINHMLDLGEVVGAGKRGPVATETADMPALKMVASSGLSAR